MPPSHGDVHWNELNTNEPEKAVAFYQAVLGWQIQSMPMGEATYHMAVRDDVPLAGIFTMTPDMAGIPEHWFTYFAVDDADVAVAAVTDAGGTIVRPPFEVPGVGRILVLRDVNGAALGLVEPAKQG